jgi:hypothetical protein
MEGMTSREITESIHDAYEELKYIRRRARNGYPCSDDEETQKVIVNWLDAAYAELEKRNHSSQSK